jgi:hypothetical protein
MCAYCHHLWGTPIFATQLSPRRSEIRPFVGAARWEKAMLEDRSTQYVFWPRGVVWVGNISQGFIWQLGGSSALHVFTIVLPFIEQLCLC